MLKVLGDSVPVSGSVAAVSMAGIVGFAGRLLAVMVVAATLLPGARAAQVVALNTQTSTATGAGAGGKPTISSFNIPSGKNRALFIWSSFERDHCSPADAAGGLCTSGNTAGTGLGDNWPEPRVGTPPATTTLSQITARVVGPGGTINKQNALVIGGTPSGDTRFITISTSPTGSPAGTTFFSVSSFHIVLLEDEIQTLLGGAASGSVSITLPDVSTPSNAGDDALLLASVFQNVEQTDTGFVRNATATAQVVTGTPGNFTLPVTAYDAGQVPNEADDGKLVMATNSSVAGFAVPAGHAVLATPSTTNAGGTYDTPNGNVNDEPNGVSSGAYFRNGGATPGSLYTLTAAGAAATLVYGGTTASFLLESDNADVGDAPISYGNATHTVSGIRLGASVDADPSLLNNPSATGDDLNNVDDEDGIALTPLLPVGQTTNVAVSIQNGSGFLSVWFDWNNDGDFNDAGEQIANNQSVAPGTTTLAVAVPVTAVTGSTFARFRVCTTSSSCSTPAGTVQSGEVEDHQFVVARALVLNKVSLGAVGGPFGFTLGNTVQANGTVTTTALNAPTQVDGDTATTGTQVFTVVSASTAVTINESALPAGWLLTGATCVNASNATVGSLSGAVYTITGAEVAASSTFSCTFTNTRQPVLRLQKSLPNGRFVATDQFTLGIAGTGGPASATTTGAGTVASGIATLSTGAVGATYTFTEAAAAGALLANYATVYACTNALASGQAPAGTGVSFAVTAVAGDDLTCTFANTRNAQAGLVVTKTNTPLSGPSDQAADTVVRGATTIYSIVVSNTGPDAANGAVLRDPAQSGLTCTTATCGTALNGAACPAATGVALASALQSASGVTIPTMPLSGSLTFAVSCTVD